MSETRLIHDGVEPSNEEQIIWAPNMFNRRTAKDIKNLDDYLQNLARKFKNNEVLPFAYKDFPLDESHGRIGVKYGQGTFNVLYSTEFGNSDRFLFEINPDRPSLFSKGEFDFCKFAKLGCPIGLTASLVTYAGLFALTKSPLITLFGGTWATFFELNAISAFETFYNREFAQDRVEKKQKTFLGSFKYDKTKSLMSICSEDPEFIDTVLKYAFDVPYAIKEATDNIHRSADMPEQPPSLEQYLGPASGPQ